MFASIREKETTKQQKRNCYYGRPHEFESIMKDFLWLKWRPTSWSSFTFCLYFHENKQHIIRLKIVYKRLSHGHHSWLDLVFSTYIHRHLTFKNSFTNNVSFNFVWRACVKELRIHCIISTINSNGYDNFARCLV